MTAINTDTVIKTALEAIGFSSVTGLTTDWSTLDNTAVVAMSSATRSDGVAVDNLYITLVFAESGGISSYTESSHDPLSGLTYVDDALANLTVAQVTILDDLYDQIVALEDTKLAVAGSLLQSHSISSSYQATQVQSILE